MHAHAYVSGTVQGVSFRYRAQAKAMKHKVNGWIRNLEDGRVELEAEGEADAVEMLIEWCRRGPMFATVTGVEVTYGAPKGFESFDVLR